MALAAYLLCALLFSQGGPDCKRCKNTGLVVCPEEARHACTGTAALRCSIAASCPQCAGTHDLPCAKCGRVPAPGRAAAQAANRAWLVELEPIDAVLGRRLVRWLEESALVAGTFEVNLEVRAGNVVARRFYRALGYSEADVLPGYYDRIEDAVRLTRDLRIVRIDQRS